MRIGDLAARTGVSRDALRLYERRGLVRSQRRINNYRDFPEDSVAIVDIIRTAQQLGFTLGEIGALTAGFRNGADAQAVSRALRDKLGEIDAKIARLTGLRRELVHKLTNACPIARASLA